MKKILLFCIGVYSILSSSVLSGYSLADLWGNKAVANVKKQDIRQIYKQEICKDGMFFADSSKLDEHPYCAVENVASNCEDRCYKSRMKNVATVTVQPNYKHMGKDLV